MSYENLMFAIICWFCAFIFGIIALWAFKCKNPMHFWSGTTVSPKEISDIPAYNRANGWMWAIYTACMVLSGIVGLFHMELGAILLVIVCVPGLFVLIAVYKRIYNRYRS